MLVKYLLHEIRESLSTRQCCILVSFKHKHINRQSQRREQSATYLQFATG